MARQRASRPNPKHCTRKGCFAADHHDRTLEKCTKSDDWYCTFCGATYRNGRRVPKSGWMDKGNGLFLIPLTDGDEDNRGMAVFDGGTANQMMEIAAREYDAGLEETPPRQKKWFQEGHAAVHGTDEEKQARWQKMRDEYDRLDPKLSKTARYKIVAKKLSVPHRTVRRAVEKYTSH